jgi:hypothetical protein
MAVYEDPPHETTDRDDLGRRLVGYFAMAEADEGHGLAS